MEATVEAPSAQTRKDYTSRPGALSRFFRMSQDGWKSKYKDLKATVKGYKNRLAHLTRSREQWRIRAERAGEQITTLEVEIAELRARLAALGGGVKKNATLRRTPPRVGPVPGEGFRDSTLISLARSSLGVSSLGVSSLGVRLCFWFRRQHVRTKNKVSCIGLVYTAPVHPSLKAVSLSTAGPEKVSSDGPLGDSCIGLVYTAPVHPSLKAVSLSTAGPEKVSSDGPLGD